MDFQVNHEIYPKIKSQHCERCGKHVYRLPGRLDGCSACRRCIEQYVRDIEPLINDADLVCLQGCAWMCGMLFTPIAIIVLIEIAGLRQPKYPICMSFMLFFLFLAVLYFQSIAIFRFLEENTYMSVSPRLGKKVKAGREAMFCYLKFSYGMAVIGQVLPGLSLCALILFVADENRATMIKPNLFPDIYYKVRHCCAGVILLGSVRDSWALIKS